MVHSNTTTQSAFRSEAWVQAWIDTWGKDPRIELIDLGGRQHPLEQVYRIKHTLKKILPVSTLCLAGNGFASLSTPRAEYNNLDSLLAMAGSLDLLRQALAKIRWHQFVVSDIDTSTSTLATISELSQGLGVPFTERTETSYAVCGVDYPEYLASLGSNTRLTYFNRRQRLEQEGEIAFINFDTHQADQFFSQLNQFHVTRWGAPCYSTQSQAFMRNFIERLEASGGKAILQAMTVNGDTVSVIYDFVWNGTRYNLQSGYYENRYAKVALGALHFGYAIQAALEHGMAYDFMAGMGKNSNYKEKIANTTKTFKTQIIEKPWLAKIRQLTSRKTNNL